MSQTLQTNYVVRTVRFTQAETKSGRSTISGITQSSGTATATTAQTHGLSVGDRVWIAGANQAGYNGQFTILTVPSTTTFTFAVDPATVTPATTGTALTVDDPLDVSGMRLIGIEWPAAFTGTSITFEATTTDNPANLVQVVDDNSAGAATYTWGAAAAKYQIRRDTAQTMVGPARLLRLVSQASELAARTMTLIFFVEQP